jgi:hypothetical protein
MPELEEECSLLKLTGADNDVDVGIIIEDMEVDDRELIEPRLEASKHDGSRMYDMIAGSAKKP